MDGKPEHQAVRHPRELLPGRRGPFDRLLDWFSDKVLASRVMFGLALVLPLLVLPMSTGVKVTLGVISGSWIQWWALHAMRRGDVEADRKRDAKADADHEALTSIHQAVDEIRALLVPTEPMPPATGRRR